MMDVQFQIFTSKWFGGRILSASSNHHRRLHLRKFTFLATILAVLVLINLASAQQGDAMIGFGTMLSPGAAACGANPGNFTCPQKGGLYTNISADVIFHKRFGAGFDASWRSLGDYAGLGQAYRPIQFAFDGVYQPRISKKVGADLFGGIGWQTTRFYSFQPTYSCEAFGACYTSANHFLVNFGGGVRYYVWGNFFLRPEARFYHILNNGDFFSSDNVIRVGASIGYTIGGPN
jgi:hypothetical protein